MPTITDLLAIAKVRRMLMELGLEISPAAMGAEALHVGALELWLHQRHDSLQGATPLEALQTQAGEDSVRLLLRTLSESSTNTRVESTGQAGDEGGSEAG